MTRYIAQVRVVQLRLNIDRLPMRHVRGFTATGSA
jgi:hypothetical protein